MREYDDAVLECFLDKQLQLFPEPVAETMDEAEDLNSRILADFDLPFTTRSQTAQRLAK